MPPDLALLIGAGFVYYAFRSARKRGAIAPTGLFWPTLWYLVVASRMIGLWFQAWGIPLPGGSGLGNSTARRKWRCHKREHRRRIVFPFSHNHRARHSLAPP